MKRPAFTIRARQHHIVLGKHTCLMGVLNITPDSFSKDGLLKKKYSFLSSIVKKAKEMVADGANILDIGGESSRPGAAPVPSQEEMKRIIPVIEALVDKINIPLSVDTCKPEVAKEALKAGASMINNIQGTQLTSFMLKVVYDYDAAIILMHMRGKPRTMQRNVKYNDLIGEIKDALRSSVKKCLDFGIKSDKMIIDPGIGFGKSVEQNFEIINRLNEFHQLGCPILLGPSRKSFIGKALKKDVSDRLYGTLAAVTAGIINGAHIVRVHDVKETKDAVKISDCILYPNATGLRN